MTEGVDDIAAESILRWITAVSRCAMTSHLGHNAAEVRLTEDGTTSHMCALYPVSDTYIHLHSRTLAFGMARRLIGSKGGVSGKLLYSVGIAAGLERITTCCPLCGL